ncbi:MAG: polyphosphate kinase 1 [Bacteroidetes bacterium 4572_77]|nr:MAG: polyphosphate kinase 1 [Bacteroidetes bacterium 4572_77]
MENNQEYINRELSWLDFNYRVLQEAMDPLNPLLERFKFLGIFSNNRDEFFRVRVATLNRLRKFKKLKEADKEKLESIILKIQERVNIQEREYTNTYNGLIEEAKIQNIFLLSETELNKEQQSFVKEYFQEKVRKYLFPLMLGDAMRYNNFKDQSVYLSVVLHDSSQQQKSRYALLEVPSGIVDRFVELPSEPNKTCFIFLEDIIRFNLGEIFSILGFDNYEAYLVKLTREAELDIDNDVLKSFMEIMSESVKKRKKAPPVRFIYDKNMGQDLLNQVLHTFGIKSKDHIRAGGRYHNLKDLMNFPVKNPSLAFKPLLPIVHPDFPINQSNFEILKKKDVLLHFPYHSFKSIISFVWEASIDPKVRAIKMTFYRVSRNSNVMRALINAARNGKKVTVFMELQARFDEEDNIFWSEKLQEEGVRIIPTIPGFKVHSKLILIRRKEKGENVYYSSINTGNFHEQSAKVYSDIGLLTQNPIICEDVNKVFYMFESKFKHPSFKLLKVSPFKIRNFIYKKIDFEINTALHGKEASIVLKVNNLTDKGVIERIYKAADAGVKITLIVRGICVLKKNNKHKNIEAFGVVDRFLEHSRLFVFSNDGEPEYYLSSADLMSRNLDRRIEVVFPVLSPQHKKEMEEIIQFQIGDNVKSRYLQAGQINTYKRTQSSKRHQSQLEIYDYLNGKK